MTTPLPHLKRHLPPVLPPVLPPDLSTGPDPHPVIHYQEASAVVHIRTTLYSPIILTQDVIWKVQLFSLFIMTAMRLSFFSIIDWGILFFLWS